MNKTTLTYVIGGFVIVLAFFITGAFSGVVGAVVGYGLHDDQSQDGYDDGFSGDSRDDDSLCTIASITVAGAVAPVGTQGEYGEHDVAFDSAKLIETIGEIDESKRYDAILLNVNSPGGSPVAGEAIFNAISSSSLPVYVHGYDILASSAYYFSLAAKKIFAHSLSEVGSIGVTASFQTQVEKDKKEGLAYHEITSGKYKDIGSSNKLLTEEEKTLVQTTVNQMATMFESMVSKRRGLSSPKVHELADGRTYLAADAVKDGLIDGVLSHSEVVHFITREVNKGKCQVVTVELE